MTSFGKSIMETPGQGSQAKTMSMMPGHRESVCGFFGRLEHLQHSLLCYIPSELGSTSSDGNRHPGNKEPVSWQILTVRGEGRILGVRWTLLLCLQSSENCPLVGKHDSRALLESLLHRPSHHKVQVSPEVMGYMPLNSRGDR